MLSGEGNEKGEKQQWVKLAKKQLCTCSTLFFVHFFAVVLHDYNVKLQKLPSYTFYDGRRKCRTCSCSLFILLELIFALVAASISHSHHHYKIFMVFFQQKISPLLFFSRSSSLPLFFSLSFAGL